MSDFLHKVYVFLFNPNHEMPPYAVFFILALSLIMGMVMRYWQSKRK